MASVTTPAQPQTSPTNGTLKPKKPGRIAVAGLVLAALTLVVAIIALVFNNGAPRVGQTATVSGSNNSVGQSSTEFTVGPNGCVALNGSSCIDPVAGLNELREQIQALPHASDEPSGSGPWLFFVVGTGQQGLYVRDGHSQTAHRVAQNAVVAEGRAVYAECFVNDWDSGQIADAPHSSMKSDRWYRVRYPEIADAGSYWMSSGYLYPVGHNGNIPPCAK